MITINVRRLSIASSLAVLLLLNFTSASQAAFVFTGETIDVSYTEPGVGLTDAVVAGTGPEIAYLDGSDIGDGIMLDFEFIDIDDTSVTFNLRGDGPAHPTDGYQTTGLAGSYTISLTAADFSISNVSLGTITDTIGVAVGSEVTFDAGNIYFDISTLGIREITPGADLGTVTLNVEFVPIPAALPLMLSGLAGLLLLSRRRKI